jgi:plastocyanin
MKKIIVALVILIIVAIGAYYLVFSNNSSHSPTGISTPDTQTPPASSNVTVSIKNFSFNPSILTIKVGIKVTWVNDDGVNHTITSDSGSQLNSATILPGQSFDFTFNGVGTSNYHCSIHPMMKGTVVVTN